MKSIEVSEESAELLRNYLDDPTRKCKSLEGPAVLLDLLTGLGLSKENAQKYINQMTTADILDAVESGELKIAAEYFE